MYVCVYIGVAPKHGWKIVGNWTKAAVKAFIYENGASNVKQPLRMSHAEHCVNDNRTGVWVRSITINDVR